MRIASAVARLNWRDVRSATQTAGVRIAYATLLAQDKRRRAILLYGLPGIECRGVGDQRLPQFSEFSSRKTDAARRTARERMAPGGFRVRLTGFMEFPGAVKQGDRVLHSALVRRHRDLVSRVPAGPRPATSWRRSWPWLSTSRVKTCCA